jgi:hypothetical protein
MDPLLIGLRVQDFHESLKNTATFGPKDVHYKNTLLIGKAATLAMHLRGLLYIDNYQQLEYAAASLGISSLELSTVLHELEVMDFISVVRSGSTIRRIDIRVPQFRSGYADLGERWKGLFPSEIEQASVALLDRLYKGPLEKTALLSSMGLDETQESIMLDVMESGSLATTQTIEGQPLIYTPLAVDGNPAPYLQWARSFPDEVANAIEILRDHQGLSLDDQLLTSNPALTAAITTGVLMPVEVRGATGEQHFVFAPHGALSQEESIIMDKARAILSCVRYGQKFAAGTPIRYPRLILERLRDYKRFSRGHPDLFTQYGLLVEKLIGHPVDEGKDRWNFELDDTEENIKALNVALEMLKHGEAPSARISLEAKKALLSPSGYQGPISTRARMHLSKGIHSSPKTRADIIHTMADLMRGVTSHG